MQSERTKDVLKSDEQIQSSSLLKRDHDTKRPRTTIEMGKDLGSVSIPSLKSTKSMVKKIQQAERMEVLQGLSISSSDLHTDLNSELSSIMDLDESIQMHSNENLRSRSNSVESRSVYESSGNQLTFRLCY